MFDACFFFVVSVLSHQCIQKKSESAVCRKSRKAVFNTVVYGYLTTLMKQHIEVRSSHTTLLWFLYLLSFQISGSAIFLFQFSGFFVSFHVVSCCFVSFRVVSCRVISFRFVSFCFVLCRFYFFHTNTYVLLKISVSFCVISCRVMSFRVVSYRSVSFHVVPCRFISFVLPFLFFVPFFLLNFACIITSSDFTRLRTHKISSSFFMMKDNN